MSTVTVPEPSVQRPRSGPGDPPWEIALLYPAQGQWSEADYLELKTHRLIELCDGCLEVLPMPTVLHQLIVKFLLQALDAVAVASRSGTALCAPLPVHLGTGKFCEPDIVFPKPGRSVDPRGQPEGADLAMEVVSEGEENRKRDLVTKRREDPLLRRHRSSAGPAG